MKRDLFVIDYKEQNMTNLGNAVAMAVFKAGGVLPTAGALEVHPQTINIWIKRNHVPKHSFAKRLAALSGVSIETLRSTEIQK